MFSTIVAWVVFVFISLVPVFVAIDAVINAEYNRRVRAIYRLRGQDWTYSPKKILVAFAIWFASGYYLFG